MSYDMYVEACDLIEVGDFIQSQIILKEIIDKDPEHYRAINKLGVIYASRGLIEEAEKCFIKALEFHEEYPPAIVNMGNICKERKDYDSAMKYYLYSIEIDPAYYFAYYNIAVLYKKKNNYDEYIKYIKFYKKAFKEYSKNMRKEEKKQFSKKVNLLNFGSNLLSGINSLIKK